MYSDRKGEDVRLVLAQSVPQGRIAKLTGVSLRTIRGIAREPADPAKPHSDPRPRRSGPARASVVGPYRQVVTIALVLLFRVLGKAVAGRGLAIRAALPEQRIRRKGRACGDLSL